METITNDLFSFDLMGQYGTDFVLSLSMQVIAGILTIFIGFWLSGRAGRLGGWLRSGRHHRLVRGHRGSAGEWGRDGDGGPRGRRHAAVLRGDHRDGAVVEQGRRVVPPLRAPRDHRPEVHLDRDGDRAGGDRRRCSSG